MANNNNETTHLQMSTNQVFKPIDAENDQNSLANYNAKQTNSGNIIAIQRSNLNS